MGWVSSGGGVDEGEEFAKRDFLFEEAAVDILVVWIWERSALEALRT